MEVILSVWWVNTSMYAGTQGINRAMCTSILECIWPIRRFKYSYLHHWTAQQATHVANASSNIQQSQKKGQKHVKCFLATKSMQWRNNTKLLPIRDTINMYNWDSFNALMNSLYTCSCPLRGQRSKSAQEKLSFKIRESLCWVKAF